MPIRRLICALLTLGAIFCPQGFVHAQAESSSSSSSSTSTPDLGTLTQQNSGDTLLQSSNNSTGTAVFKIQSTSSSTGGKLVVGSGSSNVISSAVTPYFVQFLAFFRFMALIWLMMLTIVMGIGYALQQYKLDDLAHGIFGAFIVIAAQVLAGIFVSGLPTTGS